MMSQGSGGTNGELPLSIVQLAKIRGRKDLRCSLSASERASGRPAAAAALVLASHL